MLASSAPLCCLSPEDSSLQDQLCYDRWRLRLRATSEKCRLVIVSRERG